MHFFLLRERPEYFDGYIHCIEKAFGYQGSKYRFAQDFFPLLHPGNWADCYGILSDARVPQVIATIAAYRRTLVGGLRATILGGIAVSEAWRRKGLSRRLWDEVWLRTTGTSDFYILWSEKEEFFSKWGFARHGNQIVLPIKTLIAREKDFHFTREEQPLTSRKRSDFWTLVRESFQHRYGKINHFERRHYWKYLEQMPSVQGGLVFDSLQRKPIAYYLRGKGLDLPNIIHEWACTPQAESRESEVAAYLNQFASLWDYPFACYPNQDGVRSHLGLVRAQSIDLPAFFVGGVDSL